MRWLAAYIVCGMFTTGFVAADQVSRGEKIKGDIVIATTIIWPVAWGVAAFNATRTNEAQTGGV